MSGNIVKLVAILTVSLQVTFGVLCAETPSFSPPETYLEGIHFSEWQLISLVDTGSPDKAKIPATIEIVQVVMIGKSEGMPEYKIGYVKKSHHGSASIETFGSMWLTLKQENGTWAWGQALYIKDSKWSRRELQRPKGLITETEADRLNSAGENTYLTREVLKRAGINPKVPKTTRALLPTFAKQLNGENEVRVRNPNEFAVNVGVRSGNSGTNFAVSAYGVNSVFVPDGGYDIYFIYSNKPDALFRGDSFTLRSNRVEIQIVKVVNGNYNIQQVK
jgi:hypothetical protein